MASIAELGFDASQVEPNEAFDLIPAGEYDAVIVNSEVKATSSGNGKMVKLELQIINGEFQNRKLWDNLNLWNPSDKAVQIARGTLSAICRAVNVLTPKDTAELHGKPLRVKLAIDKGKDGYADKNVIKDYKPRSAGPAPTQQQPATAGAPAGQPW